jgi:hypothetical protein
MKSVFITGGIILSLLSSFTVVAQSATNNKIAYFKQAPEKINCRLIALEQVFTAHNNSSITIHFSDNLVISGEVIENVSHAANTQTINIKCENYGNALLTLTRIEQGATIEYVGRIVHPKSADALLLVVENGRYVFKKQQQSLFMVD